MIKSFLYASALISMMSLAWSIPEWIYPESSLDDSRYMTLNAYTPDIAIDLTSKKIYIPHKCSLKRITKR